jgi:hypothetical protein
MAASGIAYQVSAFSHNSNTLSEPFGATLDEIVQYLAILYGANVYTVIAPIQSRQVEAELVTLNVSTESGITIGQKGTLVITLVAAGGSSFSINVTNILLGSIHRDMQSPPFQKRVHFQNEGVPVISIT